MRVVMVLGLVVVGWLGVGTSNVLAADPTPVDQWANTFIHKLPFLTCTRAHESDHDDYNHNGLHDGGYQAHAPGNNHWGAYQMSPNIWTTQIAAAGYPYLAWGNASMFGMKYQDLAAYTLLKGYGPSQWGNRCRGYVVKVGTGWGLL